MRRIATAAIALCLMGGTAAQADPGHDNNGGHDSGSHNNSGHNDGGHNNGGQPHLTPHIFEGGPPNVQHGAPQVFEHNVRGGPPNPQQNNVPQVYERHYEGVRHDQGPQVYEHRDQGVPQGREFHNFGAPGFHPGGERPRYNPEFFPRIFHPQERFEWRGGHWRGPPGWYYRTWYYGQILPWGWFDEGYWISDYWFYDLPVPPYGYEWVRNGPDALLVDLRSGMIVEVVPGIFY